MPSQYTRRTSTGRSRRVLDVAARRMRLGEREYYGSFLASESDGQQCHRPLKHTKNLAALAPRTDTRNPFAEQRDCGSLLRVMGRFANHSAFLIGGGPSFLDIDIDQLHASRLLTMTLNNAVATFRSDLWLAVDPPKRFVRSVWDDAEVMKLTPRRHAEKRIAGKPRALACDCENVHFYNQDEWFKREQMFAPHDPSIWDNRNGHGCKTSLMDAIRVLYLLGVRQIFLLGVDFHQSKEHTYHYAKTPAQADIDRNNQLYRWMSKRLTRLRPLMEGAGLQIYNCNPSSRLEVFEYLDLQAALRTAEEPPAARTQIHNLSISTLSACSKVPDVTLITPTGDRPIPFRLCEWWIKKQTFKGTMQWIVVDDGKEETLCTMSQQYVRRQPQPDDPRHTLARNLLTAIPHIKSSKILIIEDDDWYSPHYVEKMAATLDDADLVGCDHQVYYRICDRQWIDRGKRRRADLCQTGFNAIVIPTLSGVCDTDFRLTDTRLWRAWCGTSKLMPLDNDDKLSIGIKQLPGRQGHTSGWRKAVRGYRSDVHGEQLWSWLGSDASAYLEHGLAVSLTHEELSTATYGRPFQPAVCQE